MAFAEKENTNDIDPLSSKDAHKDLCKDVQEVSTDIGSLYLE